MRARLREIVAVVALAGLCGCADTGAPPAAETALSPAPIVRREGVSLAEATVALVSLDGAPEAASRAFSQALDKQFAARGIVSAPPGKAHYLLRAYLAASPAPDGASLDYVVDVFDARRIRLARLGDGFAVKGQGDPWSLMSDASLDAVAGQSADEIAAFLSNTPEAKPALSYAN
ncbi:MAG: hypothetical protein KGM15_01590 [Pseudomonadota bacterium]|nr:hypothetical protein [Pseudomonadota bacterium]